VKGSLDKAFGYRGDNMNLPVGDLAAALPFYETVLGFQTATLANLLNPFRLARIRDGETRYGAATMVTIPEMMGALTQAIWTESWGPGARTTSAATRTRIRTRLLTRRSRGAASSRSGCPAVSCRRRRR